MGTNYIAPMWRMPRNTNKDKLSNYSIDTTSTSGIDCGLMADIFGTSSVTYNTSYSIWIKPEFNYNVGVYQTFFGNFSTNNNALLLYYAIDIDAWKFAVGDGSGHNYVSSATITSNQELGQGEWQHHCVVFDTINNNAYYYINNQLVNDGTGGSTGHSMGYRKIATNANFYIGKKWDLTTGTFTGQISQGCIFDYALSTEQRTYLYNLNNPMAITGGEPIAYWPLGDNSNPNASAGYPNTSVGADSVFDFDRSTQDEILIDENNNKLFQGVSAFTVSAWVKLKTNTGYDHGVVGNDGVSTRGFYMTMKNSPQLRFFVSTTGTTSDAFTYTNPTSTLNRWVHYVVIWDGSNMDMYVDGMYSQTQACVNATGTFTAPVGTVIGGPLGQGGDNKYYFDGEISNVQIWYQRLSHGTASVGDVAGGDIATLYNNGQPIMTGTQPEAANLKAWYKLNQSSNWEADSANNWQIPDATSAFPQSFNFIAANSDYIDAGDQDELKNITKLSVSLWFNYDSILTSADGLVARDSSTRVDGNWYVSLDFNNSIRFLLKTANGQDALNSSTISANKWYHTLCVWTGDVMKIYLNGDLDNSITLSNATGTLGSASDIVAIGRRFAGGGFLNGKASNVALWSSDQSLQVPNIYNNGTPATSYTNTPQYWYKLDNNELFDGTNWSVENQKYPANYESALDFNSTQGDFVNIPYNANYDLTGAQTFSFWFNQPTSQSGGSYPITFGSGSQIKFFIQFYDPIGRIITRVVDSTGAVADATNLGVDYVGNGWHHIAFTTDGTTAADKIITYFDGEPLPVKSTLANAGFLSTTVGFNFGKIPNTGFFNGQMSNVSYFDKELSPSEIQTLYNGGTPEINISHSPIAWWKLNNTTTGTQDSVGSNDGTNNGTTKVNTFVSTETGTSSGMTEQNLVYNNVSVKNGESSGMNTTNIVQSNITRKVPYSNYSINFDGALDVFDCGDSSGFSFGNGTTDSPFTISAWINTKSVGTQAILSKYVQSPTADREWLFYLESTNKFRLILVGNGVSCFATTTTAIPINSWIHVLSTYDGGGGGTAANGIKLYVNGVEQSVTVTNTAAYQAMNNTSTRVQISGWQDINEFNGEISNISIFDGVLTEDDAIKLYNNGVTQDLNNFRVTPNNWWPLDQSYTYFNGSVLVARDVISGNDGTGINIVQENIVGNAPSSEASGTGNNLTIADLKGNMYNSDKNAYSINMADYADGVTNPANSGRSTDTPS